MEILIPTNVFFRLKNHYYRQKWEYGGEIAFTDAPYCLCFRHAVEEALAGRDVEVGLNEENPDDCDRCLNHPATKEGGEK